MEEERSGTVMGSRGRGGRRGGGSSSSSSSELLVFGYAARLFPDPDGSASAALEAALIPAPADPSLHFDRFARHLQSGPLSSRLLSLTFRPDTREEGKEARLSPPRSFRTPLLRPSHRHPATKQRAR